MMELRYMGFDQNENTRIYRFDRMATGEPHVEFVVTADMALFSKHHVGIQEGPSLSSKKLSADLTMSRAGGHELTSEDFGEFTQARADALALRAESRKHR